MQGYPCKICGDFPVNSQLITCKSYILFNAISTCVPKVRNYGDFRQHVIPTVITCLLWGTPCDTGFSYTFYRGNICSVDKRVWNQLTDGQLEQLHTVAIWTFPFHQNSVKKSDDFQDLTLAQYNLKKSYF